MVGKRYRWSTIKNKVVPKEILYGLYRNTCDTVHFLNKFAGDLSKENESLRRENERLRKRNKK